LHSPVIVIVIITDRPGEEGAVLELAQVEGDEVRSHHENEGQQRGVRLSDNFPRIPGGRGEVAQGRRHRDVSMVTVFERMLLEDLEKNKEKLKLNVTEQRCFSGISSNTRTHHMLDAFTQRLQTLSTEDKPTGAVWGEVRDSTAVLELSVKLRNLPNGVK